MRDTHKYLVDAIENGDAILDGDICAVIKTGEVYLRRGGEWVTTSPDSAPEPTPVTRSGG